MSSFTSASQLPISSDPESPVGGVCNPVPNWTPRFWHGMRLSDLYGLLSAGKFRVSRSRWMMLVLLLPVAFGNSLLAVLQQIFYRRKIACAELIAPPLFIVGHFRSGTTHLYELFACDQTFGFPTMYECFAPHHFLLTEGLLPRLLKKLLPQRRPMDNMAIGFDRPQEDEFAFIGLGAPTLYRRMAFPNAAPPELVQPDAASAAGRRLGSALDKFYRALTIKKKKRLLIKSPLHTGRIAALLKKYPGAQFVHIVRDPEKMFPSLRHTWKLLDQSQAFQEPTAELDYDPLICDTFDSLYRRFREEAANLDQSRLCEVRYEDLLENPAAELQRIYKQLRLGDFERMRPALEVYLQSLGDYQANQFELDQGTREMLVKRWGWYYQRYGYALPEC